MACTNGISSREEAVLLDQRTLIVELNRSAMELSAIAYISTRVTSSPVTFAAHIKITQFPVDVSWLGDPM